MTQVHQSIAIEAPAVPLEERLPGRARAGVFADAMAMTKPGIVRLVTITALVGLALAAVGQSWDVFPLALLVAMTMLGTALSAAGANAMNQALEGRRDAAMTRTADRPVASGRWTPLRGVMFAVVLCAAGVAILWVGANIVAAGVSLATILLYVAVYTPLKSVTPLATIVGAVPGALPPLIGWTAASSDPLGALLAPGGWTIFLIVFVWQIPHFLAIAWKYREEYARAGIAVLPVTDPHGARTAPITFFWSVTLLIVTLMAPIWLDAPLGALYGAVAFAGGLSMAVFSLRFAMLRTSGAARALFLASVIHLPLVLLAMVTDAYLPV